MQALRTKAAAFALGGALFLPGCGDVESARQALSDLGHGSKFDTATREQLSSDAKGTTIRMQIVSTSAASWMDADRAMYGELAYHCRDGAPYSHVSESPVGFDGGAEALEREHPAGTTFTRVITCEPPPPFEFALEEGTTVTQAEAMVWERIGAKPTVEPDRRMVRLVRFNDRNRKYPAMASVLGQAMSLRMAQCPEGLLIERLIVAAHPQPPESDRPSIQGSYLVLGVDAPCQAADTAGLAP